MVCGPVTFTSVFAEVDGQGPHVTRQWLFLVPCALGALGLFLARRAGDGTAGFYWATRSGVTVSMADVLVPPQKAEILEQLMVLCRI